MRSNNLRQAGFTLVELMVGMALGLFILIALLALLANVSRGNSELSKSNRMIENGRLSMMLLQGDIAHAGFWASYSPGFDDITVKWADEGGTAPADAPTGIPAPFCDGASPWADPVYKTNVIGVPIAAYQVPGTFSRTTAGTAPVCASVVTNPVPGTDVLVVRHAEPCAAGSGTGECAPVPVGSTKVYFQSQRCANVGGTLVAPFYMLESAPSGTATFTLLQKDCTSAAPVHSLASTIYYVSLVSGVPTLMMSRIGANGAQEDPAKALIEHVEAFVVEFGLDNLSDTGAAVDFTAAIARAGADYSSPSNRGDGNADTYVRCTSTTPCTHLQLMNAVSAKIHVLVRSDEPTAGHSDTNTYELGSTGNKLSIAAANDGYRRQVFTQTIRLTNISGRRETP